MQEILRCARHGENRDKAAGAGNGMPQKRGYWVCLGSLVSHGMPPAQGDTDRIPP